jgi:dihydrodipicolinate synthase/N-acetylneuraminate lyase
MNLATFDPTQMIRQRRKILGISAVLLPFDRAGTMDWTSFRRLVSRTIAAGLVPAVNMDTGYVNLLSDNDRRDVLRETSALAGQGGFVAGAFIGDRPGDLWNRTATFQALDAIAEHGGTPVLFPSFGLNEQSEDRVVAAHEAVGRHCDRFIAFELGSQFAPFGKIHSLEAYQAIIQIPSCIGAKHSSLSRRFEWERLAIRDRIRPEFHVFTGHDLAIDMVMNGSDYLLGLSACAPDLFAQRDACWAAGDAVGFHELNDTLQYLGQFAFRPPVPAYKHSVAMFLKLRGWIASDEPHSNGLRRPESDREILREIAARLGVLAEY